MQTRIVLVLAVLGLVMFVAAPPANAATAITEPTGNPYHVALDSQGKAVPFTVAATGFKFPTAVFVEQCNGRAPTEPNWSPTLDCDIGTSPAPAYADAHGVATFGVNDPGRTLRVFSGESPQQIFNCLPPGAASPKNGLRDFYACQIRVSSNPTQPTSDQVFLPIVLGTGGAGSSSSSHAALWITLGAIVVLAAAGTFVFLRRRAPSR